MRFRVTYERRADLRRDLDAQLARGGLFVNVPPPAGLQYGMRLRLDLVAPDGTVARSDGEVLAAVPGEGLALSVPPEAVARLRAALDQLTFEGPDAGPPRHELIPDITPPPMPAVAAPPKPAVAPPTPVAAPRAAPVDPVQSWDALSPAEKMRLAQHGDRDERAAALRDKNRAIHPFVLKNTRLSIDELVALARNPQCAPDLLELIAKRTDWMGRPQVAEALARNPKTPNDLAVRALAHCSAEAVRQMAKGVGAPPHVIQAARKRVIG